MLCHTQRVRLSKTGYVPCLRLKLLSYIFFIPFCCLTKSNSCNNEIPQCIFSPLTVRLEQLAVRKQNGVSATTNAFAAF